MTSPIIVGGNGHSGTRLFAEILMGSGMAMGFPGISYDRKSKDLNIRGLMTRWIKPYLREELTPQESKKMRRQFQRRIHLLIPFRGGVWGFKNPRSMFLLPFYHELYPDMQFVHVIRDGRDMCFGNPFIESPTYWGVMSDEEASRLTAEERMMLFWGEANHRVKEYGESQLGDRYLRIRFEDICENPESEVPKIVRMAGASPEAARGLLSLVRKPSSIGRWKDYPSEEIDRVLAIGSDYLQEFGYT